MDPRGTARYAHQPPHRLSVRRPCERTGRAGRDGKALLFVTPREQRVLKDIERGLHQRIQSMAPPSAKHVNAKRAEKLKSSVSLVLGNENLSDWHRFVEEMAEQTQHSEREIAAALAYIYQKQQFGEMREHIQDKKFKFSEEKRGKSSRRRKPSFTDRKAKPPKKHHKKLSLKRKNT